MKKYEKPEDIPDDELPESFDWRNVKGYDFVAKPKNQEACGSCYTFSYSGCIENRLQVKYGKSIPPLSTQQMMTCNYMTEGCDGGWSQFHGFFHQSAYMVSEACAPYTASTKGKHCSDYAQCEPVAKVESVKLIGGGYGGATEKAMMKEILHSGSIEGEVSWPDYAFGYKSGVMTEKGM